MFTHGSEETKFKNMPATNWISAFNRLFEIINQGGDVYYGGSRFLNIVREVNYNVPAYNTFIEGRRNEGKSTSRRDYFYDVLMNEDETPRREIFHRILSSVEYIEPEKVATIRQILGQPSQIQGPQAIVPQEIWNADRLIEYLERLDTTIEQGNYEYTLTLAYTCLEGFYKAFIREKIPTQVHLNDLTQMAVQIRNFIKGQLNTNGISYPEQVVTLISTVTNAVCNARNDFSDSHSGNRAEKWLAVYLRDNVNSIAKLLMNFV